MRIQGILRAIAHIGTLVLDILLPPHPDDAAIRQISHTKRVSLLMHEPRSPNAHTVTCANLHHPFVQSYIYGLKYRTQRTYACAMGEAAAAIIVSAIPPNATIQLIPVPIGTTNRPYNQAQDIAEALISHIPQSSLGPTMRRKRNPAQTSVHTAHARRTNMEHVFVMDKLLDPSMFYIVVDDVRTTGATLEEARRALKASGARKVLCLAIAQTPLDS